MLLRRYFRDVGDSGLYANNEQYTDTSGQAPTDAELAGMSSTPLLQDSDIRDGCGSSEVTAREGI
jgi:hypothetical protein